MIPLAVLITIGLDLNIILHMNGSEPGPLPLPRWKNSIAVLPFVDMSPQKDQEYFCDGHDRGTHQPAEQHQGAQSSREDLGFLLQGKGQDIQDVGQRLKVDAVLEGSVRRAGNELRITAQLINCADGYHLWSETYDRELKDVFALQDEISLAIIDRLKIELLGTEKDRLIRRYTDNHEAYDSYMKGAWLLHNRVAAKDWRKALSHFESASELDADFLPSYTGLAQTQIWLSLFHFAPASETIPRAKEALRKALAIDPGWPEALTWLGLIKFRFEFEWTAGESDLRKALELMPNSNWAHGCLGDFFMARGQFDKGLAEMRSGVVFDPLSPYLQAGLGWNLYEARRYGEGLRQCENALELDAKYPFALAVVGLCRIQESQFLEAIAALDQAIALSGNATENISFLAYAYAASGNREKAQELLGEIENLSRGKYVSKYYLASIHTALGERAEAYRLLELAFQERDGDLFYLNIDPKFDALRSDPRYEAILKKIGLRR